MKAITTLSVAKIFTMTLVFCCSFCGSLHAAAEVKGLLPVPPLTAHVSDQTGTLTTEQTASLEQTLQAFEASKGSQIAILMVPTTAPEEIEQYALRVAEKWKLGRKKIDDGAILVVAKNDRTMRLEVGYGLEGPLNDATSKRIITDIITPRFKQGDFYGGINAGIEQIVRTVNGEALPEPATRSRDSGDNRGNSASSLQGYAPVIFIIALVIGGLMRSIFGRFFGALITGGAVAGVAWMIAGALSIALGAGVMALLFTLIGGGGRGLGGFIGGGGIGGGRGGGGIGGGGFGGGGGGGGFGGGGASGKW